jgi:hypothetical protein
MYDREQKVKMIYLFMKYMELIISTEDEPCFAILWHYDLVNLDEKRIAECKNKVKEERMTVIQMILRFCSSAISIKGHSWSNAHILWTSLG